MPIHYSENLDKRNAIAASGISSDSNLLLDTSYNGIERKLSLAELKKTGVQVVNVLQYGADPTGATSSSAEFASAFSSAIATDSVIYIPAGAYDLDSWTTLTLGSGESLTVVCDEGAVIESDRATDFIRCGTSSTLVWDGGRVTSFNFGFAPYANSTGGNRFVIRNAEIDDCVRGIADVGTWSGTFTEFRVENCKIHDCDTFGILIRATDFDNAIIDANDIYSIGGNQTNVAAISFGSGLSPTSARRCVVTRNRIHDISSSNTSGGVEIGGIYVLCDNAIITHNHVSDVDAASGTDCEGIYAKVRWGVISNNSLVNAGERGEGFIAVKGETRSGLSGTPYGYSMVISGNHISATRASTTNNTGIYCAIADCLISNNVIDCDGGSMYRGIVAAQENIVVTSNAIRGLYHATQSVIGITTTYDNATVTNNTLCNFSTIGSGGIYAIYLQSADNQICSGNNIYSLTGGTSQQVAIGTNQTSSMDNIRIFGNTIRDCSVGIYLGLTGSAIATNVDISHNFIHGLDRASLLVVGIWCQKASGLTVRYNTIKDINSDDSALDARGIYLQKSSGVTFTAVECIGNIVDNLQHSTNAARARSTMIQFSDAGSDVVFSNNTVRNSGIGFYGISVSNISGLTYSGNRSINNTTDWSGYTFATDAIVSGNTADGAVQFSYSTPSIMTGTGSPEGAVTAPIGKAYLRTDGGASTTLYVKESGTGNTGWVAK